MAMWQRLGLALLCVGGATSDGVCAGATPEYNTQWVKYFSQLMVDVDTSVCGFSEPPIYLTSLAGTSHWTSTGSSEVYEAQATDFRIYINQNREPSSARALGWHMQWFAYMPKNPRQDSNVCSGRTSTGWEQSGSQRVKIHVDTSACGFVDTPIYVTSLAGGTHWKTRGSTEVYHPTAGGFTIQLNEPGKTLTTADASSRNWTLNWLAAVDLGDTRPACDDICSGRTAPGNTGWQQGGTSADLIVDVDTSACGFQATPVYVTSLAGTGYHQFTTGGSEVHEATATGFRIIIRREHGAFTPSEANGKEWHVNWVDHVYHLYPKCLLNQGLKGASGQVGWCFARACVEDNVIKHGMECWPEGLPF